jgi:hypothetical protein
MPRSFVIPTEGLLCLQAGEGGSLQQTKASSLDEMIRIGTTFFSNSSLSS